MTVIVDANIIISAILSPSGKASEIFRFHSDKIEFAAPLFIQDEIESKKERLCREGNMSFSYFSKASQFYYSNILFFSTESIQISHVEKAWELTKDIDKKDTLYVALAIALDAILWTGDLKLYRSLRRNEFMNIITTKEFKEIIKGLK